MPLATGIWGDGKFYGSLPWAVTSPLQLSIFRWVHTVNPEVTTRQPRIELTSSFIKWTYALSLFILLCMTWRMWTHLVHIMLHLWFSEKLLMRQLVGEGDYDGWHRYTYIWYSYYDHYWYIWSLMEPVSVSLGHAYALQMCCFSLCMIHKYLCGIFYKKLAFHDVCPSSSSFIAFEWLLLVLANVLHTAICCTGGK